MGHRRWLAAALALAWMTLPAGAAQADLQARPAGQAVHAGEAAQADLQAATRRQTEQTEQANRDAAVPDEASAASAGAQPSRAGANALDGDGGVAGGSTAGATAAGVDAAIGPQAAPGGYGPVLYLNGKPVPDAAQRDPAEVHDEADTGANPAAPSAAAPSVPTAPRTQQQQQQQQQQRRQPLRRHPAWQPEQSMAPRPLHGDEARAAPGVPQAPPLAAPQPLTPSSNVINSCQGSFCTDAAGNSYQGIGGRKGSGDNAGVSSTGRLCNRTGATVQCF